MSLGDDGVNTRTQRRNSYVDRFVDRYVSRSTSASSVYDSVVIAGSGIGAQVFAAQLCKHQRFAGKVTIVAPPLAETRRLINGVSLRGLAADFIGSALGADHARLLQHISGPGPAPVAYRQTGSMAFRANGRWRFTRGGSWQGGRRGRTEPIVYGIRNSRLVGGIRELLADHPVTFVEEKVNSPVQLRSFAHGSNPLLVNASTIPGLLSGKPEPPPRLVLAVQVPLIAPESGLVPPAEEATAFVPLIRRKGAIDVGYFTPFSDPLSPRANWYGIFARVVDAASGFDREREHHTMTEELFGVAEAMNMSPDDPDETLGLALVPTAGWKTKIAPSQPGTLDLKRMYSEGAPCFYADGIVSAAIGGVVAAEAVARGDDPDKSIRRALRPWRRHNYLWWIETNNISPVVDGLMRVNVPVAMAYPHSAGIRMWRSAA